MLQPTEEPSAYISSLLTLTSMHRIERQDRVRCLYLNPATHFVSFSPLCDSSISYCHFLSSPSPSLSLTTCLYFFFKHCYSPHCQFSYTRVQACWSGWWLFEVLPAEKKWLKPHYSAKRSQCFSLPFDLNTTSFSPTVFYLFYKKTKRSLMDTDERSRYCLFRFVLI